MREDAGAGLKEGMEGRREGEWTKSLSHLSSQIDNFGEHVDLDSQNFLPSSFTSRFTFRLTFELSFGLKVGWDGEEGAL